MHTIYLTRHGESENNVLGIIGGNTSLTNRGNMYARRLSEYFEQKQVDVWTSCMNRTIETSQYFNQKLVQRSPNLNALNTGRCENLTYNEIYEKYHEEYLNRKKNKLHFKYINGESYLCMLDRIHKPLLDIRKNRQRNNLIICHQAVGRMILAELTESDPESFISFDIPLHTVIILKYNSHKQVYQIHDTNFSI
jgi:broad specificity phosphatase PhoE